MKKLLVALAVLLPVTAHAVDLQDFGLAKKYGAVFAAEEFCALPLDSELVVTFIEGLEVNDTAEFMNTLSNVIVTEKFSHKSMGGIEKAAHCTLAKKSASEMGVLVQ